MTASESTKQKILETKLSGLLLQVEALLHESFPYPDSERALTQLDSLTRKLLSQVSGFNNYSESVRNALALRARYILESYSELLGIIARSSATRNPFELYDPLKKLCRSILGENIHLVLSSEWSYIPFTYPMNIQELPDFIIIGMPATETENVLAFPAAAHEVGHSIWLVRNLNETVSPLLMHEITTSIDNRSISLSSIFSEYSESDFDDDLIARDLKNKVIDDLLRITRSNLEEIFCDFIGIMLFGRSYLHAFDYLVAPGGGIRSIDYPEIRRRTQIINKFAARLHWAIDNYEHRFSPDNGTGHIYYDKVLSASDKIVDSMLENTWQLADQILREAGVSRPDPAAVEKAVSFFKQSFPVSDPLSLGDLANAAWDLYLEKCRLEENVTSFVGRIADLVLKSAEVAEFKELYKENA